MEQSLGEWHCVHPLLLLTITVGIPNWGSRDSEGLRVQELILSHEKEKKNYIKSVKKQSYSHNLTGVLPDGKKSSGKQTWNAEKFL